MTNYVNYPGHRFCKNSCIIYFNDGTFSWCILTDKQKQYLMESTYLSKAKQIDIKTSKGNVYELPIDMFKKWVKTGEISEEYLKTIIIEKNEARYDRLCPLCKSPLVMRTARKGHNIGAKFWGCSGYPNCKYTEQVE